MISNKNKTFLRKNWMLLSGLIAAVIVAIWFATQVIMEFLYFNDPKNVDVDLKRWMTPLYIVETYDLPRPKVFEILQIDLEADRGRRLGRIAQRDGVTMEELTEKVREGAAQYRAQQQ